MSITDAQAQFVHAALDRFEIELPSWGFADTGTRFGKFRQDAAASTTEEKFHDAGLVHRLTGCCPSVAVHVLWDFDVTQPAERAAEATVEIARKHGVRVGSINPNVFQSQGLQARQLLLAAGGGEGEGDGTRDVLRGRDGRHGQYAVELVAGRRDELPRPGQSALA